MWTGKSTLLRALAVGVYDKVPGDGREFVVTDPGAVTVRAEDGRPVSNLDVSPFISSLPSTAASAPATTSADVAMREETAAVPGDEEREKSESSAEARMERGRGREVSATEWFSTGAASGSTSQAANVVEAVEAGATAMLLDEDTCAGNVSRLLEGGRNLSFQLVVHGTVCVCVILVVHISLVSVFVRVCVYLCSEYLVSFSSERRCVRARSTAHDRHASRIVSFDISPFPIAFCGVRNLPNNPTPPRLTSRDEPSDRTNLLFYIVHDQGQPDESNRTSRAHHTGESSSKMHGSLNISY